MGKYTSSEDDDRPGSDDQWSEWAKEIAQRPEVDPEVIVREGISRMINTDFAHWSYDQLLTVMSTLKSVSYRAWSIEDLQHLTFKLSEAYHTR